MATVSKLFRKPEDAEQAIANLKGMGCDATVIEKGGEGELGSLDLSDQALEYYKAGISVGGKVVRVNVDDAKANDAKKLLIATGFDELSERPQQWSTSPGFVKAEKMSATNPIDAQMSGDFRKY